MAQSKSAHNTRKPADSTAPRRRLKARLARRHAIDDKLNAGTHSTFPQLTREECVALIVATEGWFMLAYVDCRAGELDVKKFADDYFADRGLRWVSHDNLLINRQTGKSVHLPNTFPPTFARWYEQRLMNGDVTAKLDHRKLLAEVL